MQLFPKILNIVTAFGVLSLAIVIVVMARSHEDHIVTLPTPRPLQPIEMIGPGNQPTSIADHYGKWIVLFFGYKSCPDVCPTSMAFLASEIKQLQVPAKSVQVIFVSVDPDRDTVEDLNKYSTYFHKDFISWTGKRENIDALARQVGAYYKFEESTSELGYLVSHSADFYVLNPKGEWYGNFRPPLAKGLMAQNLSNVIQRSSM